MTGILSFYLEVIHHRKKIWFLHIFHRNRLIFLVTDLIK